MKCRKCGTEVYNKRICHSCLDKWVNNRQNAFAIAEKELGKLCKDNHKAITKRIKQIEKEWLLLEVK